MGIFGDKPEQITNTIQDENWFERDQFETVEEYRKRLLDQPRILVGKAALGKYDTDKEIFPLDVQWNKAIILLMDGFSLQLYLKIHRNVAKQLYELHQNSCAHPVFLKLVSHDSSMHSTVFSQYTSCDIEEIELFALGQYFLCYDMISEKKWIEVCSQNTIEIYQDYLKQVQYNHYRKLAINEIAKEENIWKEACKKNTIGSYKTYLKSTRINKYSGKAHIKVEEIVNLNHNEEKLWEEACRKNTIGSYETYLKTSRTNKYEEQAKVNIEKKLWEEACRKNTIGSYETYLKTSRINKYEEQAKVNIEKKLSILLGIGIFLIPYTFAWFTLMKGYSDFVRYISFVWLFIVVLFLLYLNS